MGALSTKFGIVGTLACAGLGVTSGPVFAESGWRLSGTASESISVSENNVSSLTRFSINALTQTERLRFGINTGFGLAVGSGNGVTAVLPNLGLSFGLDAKRLSINTTASFNFTPITFLEEDELDLTTTEETGIRRSIGASIRGNYDLTALSTASLSYSIRNLDYSESSVALVPSTTHNLSASLNYQAANDTTIVTSIGARWFDADNVRNSESFTLDGSVRVSYEATSRISVDAGAGITLARSQDDILGLRTVTESTAILLNGGVSYALPDGTLRLGVSQRVSPEASSGELTQFNSLNLGYSHALNSTTQLGLNLAWSDQKTIPTDESLTQFSINPSISWVLGEDVTASLGYSYRQRDGNNAHRLNFFISKSLEAGL